MEKKGLIIAIYKILYERTCESNPITYIDLTKILYHDMGIETTRKVVASCVEILEDNGIEVGHVNNKGVYLLTRPLEVGEVKFLIDCILSFNYIDSNYSADLIQKLCAIGGKPFADKFKMAHLVKNLPRGENKDLFLNVELLDDAISCGKKVSFTYNKYGEDKKLHKTNDHVVSPFYTFMVNQNYYLMGASENFNDVGFFRIEKITNVQILDEQAKKINDFEGFRGGIDFEKLSNAYPYMYSGKLEMIELLCKKDVLDDVISKFGKKIKIKKEGEEFRVSFIASTKAMEYWLMQYGNYITALSPTHLVDKIKENIINIKNRYGV